MTALHRMGGQHGTDQLKGVEVTVLTSTGPQSAEPLQRRAPEFSQQTGANIEVVTVPFAGPQWWYMSVLIQIMIIPVIVLAVALERVISRGLLVGAVKG